MSPHMFYSHYGLNTNPPATHLCYEVYRQADLIASGHLTNTNEEHAEEVFIGERFQEAWRNCTIFWYISWSPCDHCMEILLNTFLPRNPLVTLHIIFAKKYKLSSKSNIRKLSYRGVQIHVMTFPDFLKCWNQYVKAEEPFVPWTNIDRNYQRVSRWLSTAIHGTY